jgi:hypothetical protein
MSRDFLINIRGFFHWAADVFRTWFLPYHYDAGEEEEPAEETEPAAAKPASKAKPRPAAAASKPGEPATGSVAGAPASATPGSLTLGSASAVTTDDSVPATAAAASAMAAAGSAAEPTEASTGATYSPYAQSAESSALSESSAPSAPTASPAPSAPETASAPPAIPENAFTEAEVIATMAWRGVVTRDSLAAILNATNEGTDEALSVLLDQRAIEDIGDGRYLLADTQRQRVLKADPHVSKWLANLADETLQERTLDVYEQLCRQLPIKVTAADNIVFHLRQRKWMVWQSRPGACIVKMFGTLAPEAWATVRAVDRRARRFRRRDSYHWDVRDWISFRWNARDDRLAVEKALIESGRDFSRNLKLHRGQKKEKIMKNPGV